jgi:hypothetical protein
MKVATLLTVQLCLVAVGFPVFAAGNGGSMPTAQRVIALPSLEYNGTITDSALIGKCEVAVTAGLLRDAGEERGGEDG